MTTFFNLARMTVSSTGTGDITLNAAVTGFLTFDLAGCSTAASGQAVVYAINEATQSEIGTGTYYSSGPYLRNRTPYASTNGGAVIPMSNSAQVFITPSAAQYNIYNNAVMTSSVQTFTSSEQALGCANISAVSYSTAQTLTSSEYAQALTNITAISYSSQATALSSTQMAQALTNLSAVSYSSLATALTSAQYAQALTNLKAVSYSSLAATLTVSQQDQTRANISANYRGYIDGLTLSTTGSSVFYINPGVAMSDDDTTVISITSSMSKTTGAWSAGTGNGALDTGAIASSLWYHVYAIERTDTGGSDILISLSASAPTMPASYTKKHRLGAMRTTSASQWTQFVQFGDNFIWSTRVVDVSTVATANDGSRNLKTLTIPTGINAIANFTSRIDYVSAGTALILTSPSENDIAPTGPISSLVASAGSPSAAGQFSVTASTLAQIGQRANSSGAAYSIVTTGWVDSRGSNA